MGIEGLLPELPGGAMSSQQTGFSKLTMLQCGSKKVDIDSGTLIFVCALMHKEEYKAGNYLPAVQEFQRQCTSLGVIYKWDFTMIFDGHPPDEKMHEHDRRSKRGDDSVIKYQRNVRRLDSDEEYANEESLCPFPTTQHTAEHQRVLRQYHHST